MPSAAEDLHWGLSLPQLLADAIEIQRGTPPGATRGSLPEASQHLGAGVSLTP